MRSLSLVMSERFLSGRGRGHVSNFYIVDLGKISPQQVVGRQVINTTQRRRFVYDTFETMGADSIASCLSAHCLSRIASD